MARRPAYNTKAERARRAEQRASLIEEIGALDEAADELVPLLSAWVELQRAGQEYETLFGRRYSQYESRAEAPLDMVLAREHARMASALLDASRRAAEVSRSWIDFAAQASLNSWYLLQHVAPYSQGQLEQVRRPDPA